MSKIISTVWFTGVKCIGIVVVENEMKVKKAYIGIGEGRDEEMAAGYIKDNGVPVTKESLKEILDKIS